ncbi:MAG TPA: amidohydrolase family protein [Pirellulales bacterium]|jgi:putative selenium metabolism protein SsnA|nr:amidohydrolase family protein [Pirellulales bacterium]
MALVLQNALLCDIDPPRVELGSLRIDGGKIAARGEVQPAAGDNIVDCGGAVVLPGLVNGHTHLYSALAVGMPAPPRPPKNFLAILQLVWWRLDRALDEESILTSALMGALQAARCGTTTLIDHHASPQCIAGSLDLVERGLLQVGIRGVLCYETTDRNGRAGREAGLAENRRYLQKCRTNRSGRFAGLVGAHAAFTLEDESLDLSARMAEEFHTGVHIHVAEDPCDEEACRREHGLALMERLERHGLVQPATIFAHGTHLHAAAIERVNAVGLTLAHNPRSNMNNSVGYTPVAKFRAPVMLGTDGIGADMFTEARQAWFKACDAQQGLTPNHVLRMLAASARRASAALGVTLGQLAVGAEADVVITDYVPFTLLTADNLAAHFIFAIGAQHVRDVLVSGDYVQQDRRVVTCNEATACQEAVSVSGRLWERMAAIPAP